MEKSSSCNRPETCKRLKAPTEQPSTPTQFCHKYDSPPSSPTYIPSNNSYPTTMSRLTSESSQAPSNAKAKNNISGPDATFTGSNTSLGHLTPGQKVREIRPNSANFTSARTIPKESKTSNLSVSHEDLNFRLERPPIPLFTTQPPNRGLKKMKETPSSDTPTPHSEYKQRQAGTQPDSSFPLPQKSHSELRRSRLSQEIKGEMVGTSSPTERITEMEGKKAPINKMPDSDEDEIIMKCNNNRRRLQGGQKCFSNNTNTAVQQDSVGKRNKIGSRNAMTDDSLSQPRTPVNVKNETYKAAPKDAQDELKRLQQEIILQAHQNRQRDLDYPTANPETLAKCRDGPATDPNSEDYQKIAKPRLLVESQTSAHPRSEGSFVEPGPERYLAQWDSYKKNPAAYPIITDGKLVLSPVPSPENEQMQKRTQAPHKSGLQTNVVTRCMEPTQAPEDDWANVFFADWEYHPRACSNYEAFRDSFRRWLDTTMEICCYVDIYHQAFFDGTAHADGMQSLFIPDLDNPFTRLDMGDEATHLHYHETVEGYCYNLEIHIKKDEQEERARRHRARQVYIQGMKSPSEPNPNVPRANVYLRPVETTDIQELLYIYNWYAQKSSVSSDITALDAADVRQRIEDCRRERLPFLVAAERRTRPVRDNTPEKIQGYALATDSVGDRTTGRFTAELELFVKPDQKRRGIGRCLMDKLLEVCDPTYIPKRGYFFDARFEDRPGYYAGGQRKLARLIFVIGYPDDNRQGYEWLRDWLEREYQFEEQGVLKGTKVKFDRFLDVSYLVRTVAYNEGGSFKK